MDELPDLGEIEETLSAIDRKEIGATNARQLDVDHRVLLNVQSEVNGLLTRELPATYDKDDLRAILDRIVNAIEDNRSKRKA